MAITETFNARLEPQGPNNAWTLLRIPFDVFRKWGTRARLSVAGTINGFPFRSSIFPGGDGTHHMMVNKAMKLGARAAAGDAVSVTLAPDTKPRVVAVPPDLRKAISGDPAAKKLFATLSPSCRKEYVEWITSAKREETRVARIAKAVAMLAGGRRRVDD